MNALEMWQINGLNKEFKRLLGTLPDAFQFETPNTLWVRLPDTNEKVWLTTYPDGILKFDDLLAKAIAKHENAKRMILGE